MFDVMRDRLRRLIESLTASPLPAADLEAWFRVLHDLREIQGNAYTDLSTVACILARNWLCANLDIEPFDVTLKSQSAPGLDIETRTRVGERVVGEIKTTLPYHPKDFGAAQTKSVKQDFDKLCAADAPYRFFFVTDSRSLEIVNRKFAHSVPGVRVIRLRLTLPHSSGRR